ncbi:MAG: hypothetical protein L6Q29_03695 [Candidatus Pacebacteria bacterium]|nr:hypothetical protein [Candidatus Paceibacterota bacterium]NUQ57647.1 hypothetical protein [Candidatus Paceibacter sp.]
MKKIIIILVAIVAIGGIVWLIKGKKEIESPDVSEENTASIVSAMNEELNVLEVNNIDADFKEIDKDLQGL